MVLWVLATPDSFSSIALRFGVHPSSLHFHYLYIIEALREMAPRYIHWPDENERIEIANTFERATGFPGVFACIDCTHVYVTAPVEQPARYRNRHDSYSLNVQAVCDHRLRVRNLHVGEVGSMNDKRVFRRSPIYRELLEDDNGQIITADQHLVGDGGYTLTDFMLIPYQNNGHLTREQLRFNRKLSQCRIRIENAFGRAKGKWRRLKFLHAFNAAYVVDHITACFVLHNFIIDRGEDLIDEEELRDEIGDYEEEEEEGENANAIDAAGEDHPSLAGAKIRGLEKRHFITYHVL